MIKWIRVTRRSANDAQHVYVSGEKYSLKENDLIKNVILAKLKMCL